MSNVVTFPAGHRPSDARSRAVLRRRLGAAVERLIDIMDAMDTDPDFEPSLGWTRTMAWGSTDDREEETQ